MKNRRRIRLSKLVDFYDFLLGFPINLLNSGTAAGSGHQKHKIKTGPELEPVSLIQICQETKPYATAISFARYTS